MSLSGARIELDRAALFTEIVGPRLGLRRRRLQELSARMAVAQEELREAGKAGLVPYLLQARDRGAAEAARTLASTWTDPLLVIGEPGSLAAARLLATTAGAGEGLRGGRILFVDGPDAPDLADRAGPARHIVLLDGPEWVRRLGVLLVPGSSGATVFSGDGTERDGWTLPGSQRIDGFGASDARFGVLGAASLALGAAVGVPVESVMESAESMSDRCLMGGLFDNPALNLAAIAWALAEDHRLYEPVFLVGNSRLEGWAQVMARSWSAITAGTPASGAMRRAGGFFPRVYRMGDEAQTARLLDGSPDAWAVSIVAEGESPLGEGVGADLRGMLLAAQLRQLVQGGVPTLKVRLGEDGPATLGGASLLFVHAATVLAVLRDVDPLAIPAADRLRELQDSSFGDNGAA